MPVLGRAELDYGIRRGQFIKNPRTVKDEFIDLQAASYDLTAGVAVWKERPKAGTDGNLRTEFFDEGRPRLHQPTVTLQPGQMMSIITREELVIPDDVCGTVYSKNGVALKGIFAFNAGHVDPGYRGPIIIRLLSLRQSPFPLTLGEPVFLIVFEKLDKASALANPPVLTQEQALSAVRTFANEALSNALFDVYTGTMEDRLDDHKAGLLAKLREEFANTFVDKAQVNQRIAIGFGIVFVGLVALAGAIVNIVTRWSDFLKVLGIK